MTKSKILAVITALVLSNAASANLEFKKVGDANWSIIGSEIHANKGSGFLVSKESYKDFYLRVEFSAGIATNSGVFFGCTDPESISDKNCFEANIFDTRPDQTFRTGAITGRVAPKKMINAEDGKFHTFEIFAVRDKVRVVLDGAETAFMRSSNLVSGRLALQLAQGQITFRNLEMAPLQTDALDARPTIIDGVWELKSMEVVDSRGNSTPWCVGAYGVIMYTNNFMSTAVNCTSDSGKSVVYSGPFEVRGQTVLHHAHNAAIPSLVRTHVREFRLWDDNNLELSGALGDSKVIVKWVRR